MQLEYFSPFGHFHSLLSEVFPYNLTSFWPRIGSAIMVWNKKKGGTSNASGAVLVASIISAMLHHLTKLVFLWLFSIAPFHCNFLHSVFWLHQSYQQQQCCTISPNAWMDMIDRPRGEICHVVSTNVQCCNPSESNHSPKNISPQPHSLSPKLHQNWSVHLCENLKVWPTDKHSCKKCFCLREPVFWGRIFLIWRRNFPNME